MTYRPGFVDLYNKFVQMTEEFREGVINWESESIEDPDDLQEYELRVALQEAAWDEYQSTQG